MAETRGQYSVGSSTDEGNANESETTTASQWFAKVPATVIRDRRLKSGTRDVLIALLLYADPSGMCRPSQARIADDLGISREEVNRRIRQLKAIGYLTSDAPTTKGGTAVYHLHLTPRCDETVTPCAQPVIKRSQGCDEMITPPVIKRSHRTDPYNRSSEQRESDADASGAADASAAPRRSSKKRERQRKLTDEELPAQREEAVWCNTLLAAYRAALDVTKLPNEGRERDAAHWFYGQLQGVEGAVEKVMACYVATKLDPWWMDKPLSLQKLREYFPEYRKDPAGYRQRMANGGKPRAVAALAAGPARIVRTVDDVSPWNH